MTKTAGAKSIQQRVSSPTHTLNDQTQVSDIIKRIHRAQGQLGGVARMLEEGKDCEAVITQIAAVSKAINSAAFMLISASLKECLVEDNRDAEQVSEQLKKLFLSLA
jgi:CsoR family transcriptional regulator, copper-sensing transcriptional repressor